MIKLLKKVAHLSFQTFISVISSFHLQMVISAHGTMKTLNNSGFVCVGDSQTPIICFY